MESRTKIQKPAYKLKGPVRATVTPNHFFEGAPAGVCDSIGSHATTQTLGRLAQVSKNAKYCFEKSLNFHHDAHVILQAILNDPEEVQNLLLQAESLYGRENVWKLLLLPVPGTEEHCNPIRHWGAETAICAAARAGNLYQYLYELEPMPKDENAELEHGKLYVAIESLGISNENVLTYRVIDPEGRMVRNSIYQEQLGCTMSAPLNLGELQSHLPAIMAITYERGETNSVNPQHPEIAGTYLLNQLFKYFTPGSDGHHYANMQLQNLQASGNAMFSYVELVDEYDNYINEYYNRDWGERDAALQKGVGGKQRNLQWFGLGVMCDDVKWDPMPDFNQLPAPVGEPMLDDYGKKVSLKGCLSDLGSSWAIYHYDRTIRISYPSSIGGECGAAINRDVIRRFVEVKNMQLGAFIAWQKLLEEKYRDEQKHSFSLSRK